MTKIVNLNNKFDRGLSCELGLLMRLTIIES